MISYLTDKVILRLYAIVPRESRIEVLLTSYRRVYRWYLVWVFPPRFLFINLRWKYIDYWHFHLLTRINVNSCVFPFIDAYRWQVNLFLMDFILFFALFLIGKSFLVFSEILIARLQRNMYLCIFKEMISKNKLHSSSGTWQHGVSLLISLDKSLWKWFK